MKELARESNKKCPCGSGKQYSRCCADLLSGARSAENALELMRSRYTAYALQDWGYLFKTWYAATRPDLLEISADPVEWTGLKVIAFNPISDTKARVKFVARYKLNGGICKLEEDSSFVKEDGIWYYVDGKLK